MFLNQSEKEAFYDVASELRISDPQWLIDLVDFETAGTFSPKIKNPLSSARGLIQFLDSTARDLGYGGSLDLVQKNPTVESQLKGPVYDYLRPYSPYTQEFQLYMAVFFPAARKYTPDTSFARIFQDLYGGDWQRRYTNFEKSNPGITTPRDYMNALKKKSVLIRVSIPAALLIAGMIAYYSVKKRRRR